MDPGYYGLVEMLLFFGLILAFCLWQLYSVSRAKKQRIERERSETKA